MLINCPRCGFSQPKDEYCANCGINMEKYTPEKSSLVKSLSSNSFLQALILIIITVSTSFIILKQSKSSFKNTVNEYGSFQKNNFTRIDTPNQQRESPAEEPLPDSAAEEAQVKIIPLSEDQAAIIAGSTAVEDADASTKTASPETNTMVQVKDKVFYKLSYYEVDVRLIEQWSNLSQNTKMESYSSGLIQLALFNRSIKQPALKTESVEQDIDSIKELALGYKQPNTSFQGHLLKISINKKTGSTLSGNIQIYKSTNEEISVPFMIQKDSLFFIHWNAGLTGLSQDNILSSHPPFQILDSNQFLSRSTDLLIVLESTF